MNRRAIYHRHDSLMDIDSWCINIIVDQPTDPLLHQRPCSVEETKTYVVCGLQVHKGFLSCVL
jgi:hypothetical protein